jgi:membrane-associated phospholipid phosphatase
LKFAQPWKLAVSATVCGYIALCFASGTLRFHHWFLLAAIPGAMIAGERGRRFFIDLAPIFAFWFIYDRLRLVQPFLLSRVAVRWPYELERLLLGWTSAGDVPAHAQRVWLASHADTFAGEIISATLQFVYLSHLFVLPLMLFYFWHRGQTRPRDRERFLAHIRSFTALHFTGMLIYILLPAAPPWWVSLHGMAQPTADLLSQTTMTDAMDGLIVQHLIGSASVWFAAIPSLHGAYPVLMILLALKDRNPLVITALAVYAALMFASTVVLNQHYIIDLLAGALLAWLCHLAFGRIRRLRRLTPQIDADFS